MKLVINKSYGGFSLSKEGVELYARFKGLTLYSERRGTGLQEFWLVSANERPKELKDWVNASVEERLAYNQAYANATLQPVEIPREDPILVRVVEELGDKANGPHADLKIVDIPDDVHWQIEEYDGREWVAEVHRTWE